MIRKIIRAVAVEHGVSAEDILSERRGVALTQARREAMAYSLAAFPLMTLPQLGNTFGRDHTTVMYALARLTSSSTKEARSVMGNAYRAFRESLPQWRERLETILPQGELEAYEATLEARLARAEAERAKIRAPRPRKPRPKPGMVRAIGDTGTRALDEWERTRRRMAESGELIYASGRIG